MTQWATLGEKRAELLARLGFAATGASAGVVKVNVDSILRTSQKILYEAADWMKLRRYATISLGVGQHLIDYPANANPERIKAISVDRTGSGDWSPALERGITPQMYSTQANRGWPQRYEAYEQLEFWPINDVTRAVRVFYIANLLPLTQETDRFTIDDDLVLMVALGTAKAHYRQPDAQLHLSTSDNLLARLRAQARRKTVFSPHDYMGESAISKPVVV